MRCLLRPLMRRRAGLPVVGLLLSGLLSGLLTGCTQPSPPVLSITGDGTGCPGGTPGPIRLATGSDLSSTGVRARLVQEWNQRCPDHPVQLVELAADADLQRSQMVAAEQSGAGRYDVLNLDVTWTAEFAKAGLIRELPWSARDDFLDSARRTVEFDHRIWGRPFNTDAGLLYYRLDMLKAAQTPDSGADGHGPVDWSELKRDVDLVGASVDRTKYPSYEAGYITQLADYEGLTVNALEAIWSAGGELVGADGKVVSDSSQQVHAQSGLGDLAARNNDHALMSASARTADETASLQAFAAGKVVFMRNWPYAYSVLAQTLTPGVDFEVTTLPGKDSGGGPGVSVLGGQNLAVTAGSSQPEAAVALIGFLTSRQSERCLLEAGFAATRTSAYTGGQSAPRCLLPDGAVASTPPVEQTGHVGAVRDQATGLPRYAPTLAKALANARPRPATPYYEAFTREVQAQVGRLLQDTGGQPAIADDLIRDLGPVLQGRN